MWGNIINVHLLSETFAADPRSLLFCHSMHTSLENWV
jgi:hypothetical protein